MEDDYQDDGADYGLPQQQQSFQPPSLNEPFTNADDLQLQRLTAGRAAVRQQVWDGVLHPKEGDEYTARIDRQAEGLSQRKRIAEKQQLQEHAQKGMELTAMQTAIQQQSQSHMAKNFGSSVGQFIDPTTNKVRSFVPQGWTEVTPEAPPAPPETPYPGMFGGTTDGEAPGDGQEATTHIPGEFDSASFGFNPDTATAQAPQDTGDVTSDTNAMAGAPPEETVATDAALDATADQSPLIRSDESKQMVIYNGANRQVVDFSGGKGRVVSETDASGRPIQTAGGEGQGHFGLNRDTQQFVHSMAMAGAMHLPPGQQRESLYRHLYQRGVMQALQEQAAEKRQAAMSKREEAAAQQKEATTEAANFEKDRKGTRADIAKSVMDEYKKAATVGEIPKNIATPEARRQRVNDLMAEQWDMTHPGLDPNRPITPAGLKDWRSRPAGEKPAATEKPATEKPAATDTGDVERTASPLRIMAGKAGLSETQFNTRRNHYEQEVKGDTSSVVPDRLKQQAGVPEETKWKGMPKEFQRREAEMRFARQLKTDHPQLNQTRTITGTGEVQPGPSNAGPPAAKAKADQEQYNKIVQSGGLPGAGKSALPQSSLPSMPPTRASELGRPFE